MGLFAPATPLRMAAAGVLLLMTLAPPSGAQIPSQVGSAALAIVVLCNDTLLEPNWAGQDEVECVLQDISRDSVVAPGSTSGTGPSGHTVTVSARPLNTSANATGWQTELSISTRFLYGGDVVPFTVRAKATPAVDVQDYHFEIVADYVGPGDYRQTVIVPFTAEVNHYDFATLSWSANTQVQRAGQDQVVVYQLAVTNTAVYPDSYRFTVKTDPDIRVSTPPSLYVPPGETRIVNVTLLTPHSKLYEIGRSIPVNIKINSVTGTGVYSAVGVLQLRGAYFPMYWLPLIVVGLTSAAVLAREGSHKAEARRLEKGRPMPVDLSPRQAVLLAELKRTDPDAYKERRAALDRVYKERLTDYREHRKERLAADKEEARQAKLEFAAQKRARREKRKAEKAAAKLQRKADAKEAALLRKKEKVVAKARKKLAKKKAKADKKQAKIDAKQAKIDAKKAKADAKAAEREEKARVKAEKAAQKASRKGRT